MNNTIKNTTSRRMLVQIPAGEQRSVINARGSVFSVVKATTAAVSVALLPGWSII